CADSVFSSRRRHTRFSRDWSSDVCSSDLLLAALGLSVIAALDLYEGQYGFAAVAAGFALGLVLYAGYMLLRRRKRSSPYPEWIKIGRASCRERVSSAEAASSVESGVRCRC